jgi:hypothetical protein
MAHHSHHPIRGATISTGRAVRPAETLKSVAPMKAIACPQPGFGRAT